MGRALSLDGAFLAPIIRDQRVKALDSGAIAPLRLEFKKRKVYQFDAARIGFVWPKLV
jgi:hypothetical protein